MYSGIKGSAGIGIGKACIILEPKLEYNPYYSTAAETEIKKFSDAAEKYMADTFLMADEVAKRIGQKEADIIMGHAVMMSDPTMTTEVTNRINEGMSAEAALDDACNLFSNMFSSANDPLIEQRITDINDIRLGVMKILLGVTDVDLWNLPPNTVLVAHDLTPSMTARLNKENVVGIVTEVGGVTSHSAILARALEIPAVLSIEDILKKICPNDQVVVDGNSGQVTVNPKDLEEYQKKQQTYYENKKELQKLRGKETKTRDGVSVELFCNIGNSEDAISVKDYDGEGVGLFRTEFLFMDRTTIPDEEEQFLAYKKAAEAVSPKPIIIRTLDIGGDKELPYLNLPKEDNPFLGYRAIRFCLDRHELFKTQLRAILRAGAFGDVRIMLPLVTTVDEVISAKKIIEEIKAELFNSNIDFCNDMKIGVMIETSAAVLIADLLADEVDFFSIGTNDLTQYTMAVDRGNSKVSYLYSPFQPAVLRAIKQVISVARSKGIQVGMCGEAAADPRLIPLLLCWGLDEFSVSGASVLAVRNEISKHTMDECKKIEEAVMKLKTEDEITDFLK